MICIIAPGLLEIPTFRGGAREEQHYNVGLYLSRYFVISLVSPFYKRFERYLLINDRYQIVRVYFPACKNYPPAPSLIERLLGTLSMYIYSFLASFKLVSLARKAKIIVVTDILTGTLPVFFAKLLMKKIIYSEGNLTPWINPYLFDKELSLAQKIFNSFEKVCGRIIAELCDAIRVQSSLIREGMMKNGIRRSKIVVIEPGIDTSMFSPSNKVNHRKVKIGFIGRLNDEKGALLLLGICEKLQSLLPEIKFKIIGDGPYRKHFQRLNNIEHIGWVKRSNIPKLLSDVTILLFFQKDLGVAEIEALCLGKIIIAPNVGATPRIIESGKNGFLTSPCVDCYVDTITRIASLEPQELNIISGNARKTAKELFSWEIVGEKWKSLIEHVLEGKSIESS